MHSVTNPHRLYLRRRLRRLFTRPPRIWKIMNADAVMVNIRNAFERSGMTLTELGEGLGCHAPTAKKRVVPFVSHVRPAHFDSASCGPNAGCQGRRPGEVTIRRLCTQTLKLVPFVDVTSARSLAFNRPPPLSCRCRAVRPRSGGEVLPSTCR